MPKGGALTKRAGSEAEPSAQNETRRKPQRDGQRGQGDQREQREQRGGPKRAPASRTHAPAREKEEATSLAVAASGELMPPPPKALTGYASLTPEVLRSICAALEEGVPLRLATDEAGVAYHVVIDAQRFKPEIAVQLQQAKAKGSRVWLKRGEQAAADGRHAGWHQWMLAKLYPKVFNDRIVEQEAQNEAPTVSAEVTETKTTSGDEQDYSREELHVIAKALLEHSKKKAAAAAAAAKEGQTDGESDE